MQMSTPSPKRAFAEISRSEPEHEASEAYSPSEGTQPAKKKQKKALEPLSLEELLTKNKTFFSSRSKPNLVQDVLLFQEHFLRNPGAVGVTSSSAVPAQHVPVVTDQALRGARKNLASMVKAQCSTWNKRYRSGATVRTTTMIHVPIAIAIFPNVKVTKSRYTAMPASEFAARLGVDLGHLGGGSRYGSWGLNGEVKVRIHPDGTVGVLGHCST